MSKTKTEKTCSAQTEVFSRVCGFYRPVRNWNIGKVEEFRQRRMIDPVSFQHKQTDNDQ